MDSGSLKDGWRGDYVKNRNEMRDWACWSSAGIIFRRENRSGHRFFFFPYLFISDEKVDLRFRLDSGVCVCVCLFSFLDSLHFSFFFFYLGLRVSPFFPLYALSPVAHKHNPARPRLIVLCSIWSVVGRRRTSQSIGVV